MMLRFSTLDDLARLPQSDPALSVITKLANGLFTEALPITITLMQPDDEAPPLADLCRAEDIILEGVIEQENMFMIALHTDYQHSIVLVIPNKDWLNSELYQCISDNLYH